MPRQPYSEAVKSDRRSGYIVSLQKGRGLERDVVFPLAKGNGRIRKITKPPILLLQFHKAIDFAPSMHFGQRHCKP